MFWRDCNYGHTTPTVVPLVSSGNPTARLSTSHGASTLIVRRSVKLFRLIAAAAKMYVWRAGGDAVLVDRVRANTLLALAGTPNVASFTRRHLFELCMQGTSLS